MILTYKLFNQLDSDGSGSISYMEILTKLQDILGANISNDAFVGYSKIQTKIRMERLA